MDIISHILIGKIISFNKKLKTQIWAIFFSFLPDLTQIPFFLYLGYANARPFFYPQLVDWQGARTLYPFLNTIYEIPHSLFFCFLIVLPTVLFLKLPKIAFFAYFFHLFIDILTHTSGEWAMKPFYPFNYTFNGFTDAWAWPIWAILLSWITLLSIIITISFFFRKKTDDNAFNKN
jgi:hypothetical protein